MRTLNFAHLRLANNSGMARDAKDASGVGSKKHLTGQAAAETTWLVGPDRRHQKEMSTRRSKARNIATYALIAEKLCTNDWASQFNT